MKIDMNLREKNKFLLKRRNLLSRQKLGKYFTNFKRNIDSKHYFILRTKNINLSLKVRKFSQFFNI